MSIDDLTVIQAVAFGVLKAREEETSPGWKVWAESWLSGADRSAASAQAASTAATGERGRHAARAARLLHEATLIQTEGAMLAAEGRNSQWHLDTFDQRTAECLGEAAEAIRRPEDGPVGNDSPRARELRAQAVSGF